MTTAASEIDAAREGRRLRHLLDAFKVKWLVIKGAEALAGPKERAKIAGFLSELRSAGVNMILCGLDPVAELVAQTPELAAGAVHHQTQAYDKADEEAATFARAFLDRCAIPSAANILDEPRFVEGLIAVTAGRRGAIKSLIIRAVMIATRKNAAALTKEHFQKALSGSLTPSPPDAPNSASPSEPKPRRRRKERRQ